MEPREEVRRFKKKSNTQNQDATKKARLDEIIPAEARTAIDLEHYREAGKSVRNILSEIKQDMGSYSSLHNWDDRMINTPNLSIRAACSDYMTKNHSPLDSLLAFSHAKEVVTHSGEHVPLSTIAHSSTVIEGELFFTRKSIPGKQPPSSMGASQSETDLRGRIVYLDGSRPHLQRAALLLLHAFCVRLYMEDYGFILAFINRHLELRNTIRLRRQWQEASGPEITSQRQRSLRRVVISCHIAYLTIEHEGIDPVKDVFDRRHVSPPDLSGRSTESLNLHLQLTSSSTLLTIVIPEENMNRTEEVGLLQDPQGLWNVLVVNSPARFASQPEPPAYLTPIAQYVRGVASSLVMQRQSAERILDTLRTRLQTFTAADGFDGNFAKSDILHSTIQHSEELCSSLAATVKFTRDDLDGQLSKLSKEAHDNEKSGLNRWMDELRDETNRNEDLQRQLQTLIIQMRENRNALHSLTAVLQAQETLRQGNRLKALAYLAALYLPLTASASIYSMSVLPPSATFYSFFIVFVGFTLATIMLGVIISTPRIPRLSLGFGHIAIFGPMEYFKRLMGLLNPSSEVESIYYVSENSHFQMLQCVFALPALFIVRHVLVPWVLLPRRLWMLWKLRENPYWTMTWSFGLFVVDALGLLFWPVSVGCISVLLVYVVVCDLIIWVVSMAWAVGRYTWTSDSDPMRWRSH